MIELHRTIANTCCEAAWALMEKATRSRAETIQMLHEAHAACYHIAHVGSLRHIARCEWLLARAYALSGLGAAALLHAERALELSEGAGVDDATRALCLEACARAHIALGEPVDASYCKQEAALAAGRIDSERERAEILRVIANLPKI